MVYPTRRPEVVIVCAAMKMKDGMIVPGRRHFSPEMRAVLKKMYGPGLRVFGKWVIKPYHLRVEEQGFLDSKGGFVSRKAAWEIALRAGQIRRFKVKGTLFSEDLY